MRYDRPRALGTLAAAGSAADDFLGTQGDPWDTQWDMFLALSGALVAQLLLTLCAGDANKKSIARLDALDKLGSIFQQRVTSGTAGAKNIAGHLKDLAPLFRSAARSYQRSAVC